MHTPSTCHLCHSKKRKTLYLIKKSSIVKCTGCGLIYTYPPPDTRKITSIYNKDYFYKRGNYGYSDYGYIDGSEHREKEAQEKIRIVKKYVRSGLLLDIGCAAGYFLSEAQKNGFSTKGIEISSFASDYAKNSFNLDVENISILDIDDTYTNFDAVTMWDILEHLPNPLKALKIIYSILRDEGYLFLEMSDVNSLKRFIEKEKWTHWKQDEHFLHFSQRTLSTLLKKAGFSTIAAHNDTYSFPLSEEWAAKIKDFSRSRGRKRKLYSSLPLYLLEKIPFGFERTFLIAKKSKPAFSHTK
ncbi:class I SAM-dependent methyltransferase [Patescibacteria group bacterium]|nr:class I SAM-dependent methyltransferase [Patescibacteria group bacterium]